MKYRKHMQFMEEDGVPTGGSEGGEPSGGTPPTTTVVAPAAATLDPKAFATEFGNVISEQFKKQADATAPAKVYSPEEIAAAQKAYGFWEPDDNFIKDFGNLETQKAAFLKMRDGPTKQMTNLMTALLTRHGEGLTKDFDSRLTPLQKLIEQQEVGERTERFNTKFPVLREPKLQPLLAAVASQLHAAGAFNNKTEAESFDILANGVADVIKVTNPDFQLGSGGSSAPSNERGSNQIPTTSSGSGGGGANASTSAKGLPAAAQILGIPKPSARH